MSASRKRLRTEERELTVSDGEKWMKNCPGLLPLCSVIVQLYYDSIQNVFQKKGSLALLRAADYPEDYKSSPVSTAARQSLGILRQHSEVRKDQLNGRFQPLGRITQKVRIYKLNTLNEPWRAVKPDAGRYCLIR